MHAVPDVHACRFGGTSSVIYAGAIGHSVAFDTKLTAFPTDRCD